jgi:hypothetical protein
MWLFRIAISLCLVGWAVSTVALAENQAQDAIDRNLQARAAQAREFHVQLQDATPPPPHPMVRGETGLKFYIPTPGGDILHREPPPLPAAPPPQPRIVPGKSVVSDQMQLTESQRRRQLELQTQLGNAPIPATPQAETSRQEAVQSQQLQFERENRAQELGAKIMRDSSRAVGAPR